MSVPKFTVNGRDYAIRFDYNALADYEEAFGKPLDPGSQPGVRGIRALLWAGVRSTFDDQRRDAAPSLLEIGRAMQGIDPKELQEIIEAAMRRDFPEATAEVSRGEGEGSLSTR